MSNYRIGKLYRSEEAARVPVFTKYNDLLNHMFGLYEGNVDKVYVGLFMIIDQRKDRLTGTQLHILSEEKIYWIDDLYPGWCIEL